MRITPNFLEGSKKPCTFLLCANGDWKGYNLSQRYIEIIVPKDGNFKFLLPGGNCGDIFFEIL